MYLEDIFYGSGNLTGMPANLSSIGKTSNGLPFGVQLMGEKFGESALFAFSDQLCKKYGHFAQL